MQADGGAGQVPVDDQVATDMRRFAEVFVAGCAAEGHEMGWGPDSALRLDGLCDAYLASGPREAAKNRMILAMGAYLGELIVRNGRGRWTYDPEACAAAVDTPAKRRFFPHAKVGKRLAKHSLWAFYDIAVTGRIPPDVTLTRPTPGGPTAG
jgi:hypothetical protein